MSSIIVELIIFGLDLTIMRHIEAMGKKKELSLKTETQRKTNQKTGYLEPCYSPVP